MPSDQAVDPDSHALGQRPIFYRKPGNAAEVGDVAGGNAQTMVQCCGGDDGIVVPDGYTSATQIGPDITSKINNGRIEKQDEVVSAEKFK